MPRINLEKWPNKTYHLYQAVQDLRVHLKTDKRALEDFR